MASNRKLFHSESAGDELMAYSSERARIESALARAHRALWQVRESAEVIHDEGLEHDADLLMREVQRLSEASLRGKLRKPLAGQMRITDRA